MELAVFGIIFFISEKHTDLYIPLISYPDWIQFWVGAPLFFLATCFYVLEKEQTSQEGCQ